MDKNQVAQTLDREPPGKQQLKEIYATATNGQFNRVVHFLEQTNNLSKGSTLNVFISVSRACSKNIEECELDVIQILTVKLVRGLEDLSEEETVNYVLSLFHIFQALCHKERFDELSKMQEVICPTFINTFREIKKAMEYYDCIIKQVLCSMQTLANAKESKYNQYLLILIRTLFKARNIIWNDAENAYSFALKCYNQLLNLKATSNQLFEFYNNILQELAECFDKSNELTEEILVLFLPLFFEIYQFPNGDFDLYMMEIDKLLSYIKTNFKHEQYFCCHLMIKVVTGLLPTKIEEFPENVIDIEKSLNTFKACHKKIFYNVISFLSAPLSKAFEYYMITDEQKFTKLPENVIQHLVKFLFEEIISQSLMSLKECSCGCATKKNNKAFRIGLMLVELLILYIKQLKTSSKKLLIEITKWLGFLYDFLKEIKENDCTKWSPWCSKLTQQAYRICVILDSAKNIAREEIIKCYLKNSLAIEGPRSGEAERRSETVKMHKFGIFALSVLESERKNWMESMGFTAFHCLLYSQDSAHIFHNQWILLKIKMKEDTNLQQQTLVKILYKQREHLSEFLNIDGLLTKSKQIELLKFELTMYRSVWKSRASMTAAFDHICKIADPLTIADVILQIYSAGDVNLSESTQIFNTRATLEKNKTRESTLALAVLRFYQYKNLRNELTNRTEAQMKNKQVKKTETMGPIPKDRDDECDIVSVYSHLRLVEFVKVLNLLDLCLVSIQNFIDGSLNMEVLNNLIKLLAKIGLEYKLHNFSIKSIQAFEISMKFACKLKATEDQLFALSNIIEMADEKSSAVKDLIVKGDLLVKQLESDCDKDLKNCFNEVITFFYTCKSKALVYVDPYQSCQAWKKADLLCEATGYKGHLRAALYVISYKLTSNNCNFLEDDQLQEPGTYKLHAAYEIFTDLIGNTVLNNSEICTLFSTVEELTNVHHQMRQPRELRNYSRNTVILAQKLNLPLRCVSLLLLLAHADITTNELSDAEVKLDGIDDIFSICDSDLVLEVPQHFRQYSPSSPTHAVRGFTLPKYLHHKKACHCFMCLNWQFQKLYLAKCNLHALINIYRGDASLVEDYANGAIKLYQICFKNQDAFTNKASMLISDGLIPDFMETFVDTLACGLYEYVFHLLRNNKKSKAKKINEILVSLLEPLKHKYAHLYKDVVLQTLTYLIAEMNLPIPGIVTDITDNDQKLNPKQLFIGGTPVSKKLPVVVPVNEREIYSPPKRRPRTKTKLFSPEKADKEESDKELSATKNEGDHPFVKPTPWSISATPATPLLKHVEAAPATPLLNHFEALSFPEFSGQTPQSHKRSVKTSASEKLNPRRTGAIPKLKIFTFDTPDIKKVRGRFDSVPNVPTVPSVRKGNTKMSTSDDLGLKASEDDVDVSKSVQNKGLKQNFIEYLESATSSQSQPIIRKRNAKMSTSDELGVRSLEEDFNELKLTADVPKIVRTYGSKQSVNKGLETAASAQSQPSVGKRNTKMSRADDLCVKRLEDDFIKSPLTHDVPKAIKTYASKQSVSDIEAVISARSQRSTRKRDTKMSTSDDLGVKRLEDDSNEPTFTDDVVKNVKNHSSKQSVNNELEKAASAQSQASVEKRNTKMSRSDLKRLEDNFNKSPLSHDVPKSLKTNASKQSVCEDLEASNSRSQRSLRKRNTKMSTSDDLGVKKLAGDSNKPRLADDIESLNSKQNTDKDLEIATIAQSVSAPVIKRVIKNSKGESEVKPPKDSLKENLPESSKPTKAARSLRTYKPKETTKKSTNDLTEDQGAGVQHQSKSACKNTRKQLLSRKIKEQLDKEKTLEEIDRTKSVDERVDNPMAKITPCKMSRV